MYASQKVQVFQILCGPESHFRHQQGHQRVGAITSSMDTIENKNLRVNGVEHRKSFDMKTLENGITDFQKQSNDQ